MRTNFSGQAVRWIVTGSVAGACGAAATAQARFSIDYHGPTNGVSSGLVIDAGDVLIPSGIGQPELGPLPAPTVFRSSDAQLGLVPAGSCTPAPGVGCGLEVDALSNGTDAALATGAQTPGKLWFSVRSNAAGVAGSAVARESARFECGADVYCDTGIGLLPTTGGATNDNALVIDGDGLGQYLQPRMGLGLIEPGGAACGAANVRGDDLDAFDWRWTGSNAVYFSLSGAGTDSCGAANENSGLAQSRSASDVLIANPGGSLVFATGASLGLGAGDDLDALALHLNSTPGFQVNATEFDWASGASDMLLFSVTPGSTVVGTLDSALGLAISPGDVLGPPLPGDTAPRIVVPAERLGLATTRSGDPDDDDLDALDLIDVDDGPISDVNDNGVEDAADIELGLEPDCNDDGQFDDVELAHFDQDDDDSNGTPDGCDDCDGNGLADYFDITSGAGTDCDGDGELDSCEVANGSGVDCNGNGLLDSCELIAGTAFDCDYDGQLDACQIAANPALDANSNGSLDSCEVDCNGNGAFDYLDVAAGSASDCDRNSSLDSCDIAANPALDMDSNGVLDDCEPAFVVTDCQFGASAAGCEPVMRWNGTPSASYSTPFTIHVDQVDGGRNAVMIYGISGPVSVPWSTINNTSLLCVKAPQQRTGNQLTGGTQGACNGSIVLHWNAWAFAHPNGLGVPMAAGTRVEVQGWYREPASAKTTVLTDALSFTVIP